MYVCMYVALLLSVVAVLCQCVYVRAYVCGAGIASDSASVLTVHFFKALSKYRCLPFVKGRCLIPDRVSQLSSARASSCASSLASHVVLWLYASRSDLVTTFFFVYVFCSGDGAVLFMEDFRTFTATFEADVG
jgi:hypothetical protein